MKKIILILIVLMTSQNSFCQDSPWKYNVRLLEVGYIRFYDHSKKLPYAIDICRRVHKGGIYANTGFDLDYKKLRLSTDLNLASVKFVEKNFAKGVEDRLNQYAYLDEELDPTNSVGGHSLRLFYLSTSLKYVFHLGKLEVAPGLGLGLRHFSHRRCQFALREKGTNYFTTYDMKVHSPFALSYLLNCSFYHPAIKNFQLNFKMGYGSNKYNYSVYSQDYNGVENMDHISFRSTNLFWSVGISVRMDKEYFKEQNVAR